MILNGKGVKLIVVYMGSVLFPFFFYYIFFNTPSQYNYFISAPLKIINSKEQQTIDL